MTTFSQMFVSLTAGKGKTVSDEQVRQKAAQQSFEPGKGEAYLDRCWEVLELWLRWDEEQRELTERMFTARQSRQEIEQLLDECDVLRRTAAEATRALLAARHQQAQSSGRCG